MEPGKDFLCDMKKERGKRSNPVARRRMTGEKILEAVRVLLTRKIVVTFDRVEFVCEDLTWKRLRNWLLTELSYYLGSTRAWAYPTHLQVEPSGVCNLSCPSCHVVTDETAGGLMKMDDFRKLMDEVGDYILFLHFWGWGEPFMNEDFCEMVRYARDKGVRVITSTNGHFFQEGDQIDRLIDSGLDVLVFALDGADPETYEKYRREGDFETALHGLRLLLKRREEKGSEVPRINLRMVVTRENEHQIARLEELARETGVDLFSLKTFYIHDMEGKETDFVPTKPEYCRFRYDSKLRRLRRKNFCKRLWNHPALYWNGGVYLCDNFAPKELSLGNAFGDGDRGFGEIWFGRDYRRLRAGFLRGVHDGLRCGDCPLNFALPEDFVSHVFPMTESVQK
jgi:MoaA/NifB/PqqE/SkfB family radical SAM enzyme